MYTKSQSIQVQKKSFILLVSYLLAYSYGHKNNQQKAQPIENTKSLHCKHNEYSHSICLQLVSF